MTKPKPILVDAKDLEAVEAYLNGGSIWVGGLWVQYKLAFLGGKYGRLWRERQRRKASREPALVLVRPRRKSVAGANSNRR
jgi:hypothetical protein